MPSSFSEQTIEYEFDAADLGAFEGGQLQTRGVTVEQGGSFLGIGHLERRRQPALTLQMEHVWGAGEDGVLLRAVVQIQKRQAVRVGMGHDLTNFCHDDLVPVPRNAACLDLVRAARSAIFRRPADIDDLIDFKPGEREPAGDLFDRQAFQIDEVPKPRNGYFHSGLLELLQETNVVCPEVTYVVDAVAEHQLALWTHAEGEPGVTPWVIAAVLEDGGMHHPGPQDLQPSGTFANRATLAAADETLHIHFRGWFGEREVGGAEAHTGALPKHAPGKVGQSALQVTESDVPAYCQALDLVKLHLQRVP